MLIYSSHDREHNNAVALRDYLQRKQASHARQGPRKAALSATVEKDTLSCRKFRRAADRLTIKESFARNCDGLGH